MSLLLFEAPEEVKVCLLIVVVLVGILRVDVLMLGEELALAGGSGTGLEDVKVWVILFVTWMSMQNLFRLWSFQRRS
jgi:hypothetical protein